MRRVLRRPSDSRRASTSSEGLVPRYGTDRRGSLPHVPVPPRSPVFKARRESYQGPMYYGPRQGLATSTIPEVNANCVDGGLDKRCVIKVIMFMGLAFLAVVLFSLYRLVTWLCPEILIVCYCRRIHPVQYNVNNTHIWCSCLGKKIEVELMSVISAWH